jgi:hypothetical protein
MKNKNLYLASLSNPFPNLKFTDKHKIYVRNVVITELNFIENFILNTIMINNILDRLEILNKLDPHINYFSIIIIINDRTQVYSKGENFTRENLTFA